MLGQSIELVIPSNGSLYKRLNVQPEGSMAAWTGQCYLYDHAAPTVSVAEPTVTINATAKTIEIFLEQSVIATLFDGERVEYFLTLLMRPGLASEVQFMYGRAVIVQGGPPWS